MRLSDKQILLIMIIAIITAGILLLRFVPLPFGRGYIYSAQIIRVDPLNLTVMANNETLAENNFRIIEWRWFNIESFHTSSYLDAGDLGLNYWMDDNETHVVFYYLSNETGVLNRFWERYAYYFNLSEASLENEKQLANYSIFDKKARVVLLHEGKPVWERVFADAGELVVNDYSSVGKILLEFDSGATARLFTNNLKLEQIVPYKTGSELTVRLYIDADSDIELVIFLRNDEVDNRLEEGPSTYFVPIFEILDLPISPDKFEFVEHPLSSD